MPVPIGLSAPTVVLVGVPGAAIAALGEALQASAWNIEILHDVDERTVQELGGSGRTAFVLVELEAPASPGAVAALAGRPEDVPLIALGRNPDGRSRPNCWLSEGTPRLVESALARYAGLSTLSPGPWRRKSDMIIGVSRATRDLLHALDRIALSTAPVLITGQTGTGKELVARALHTCGPRASQRFVAINCAAIPETLFEAELFGYNRGAFTGAVSTRPGLFEAASGGTLFLDEIGEVAQSLQAKLLRVLETGEVTRLGSNESRKVDARLVAATNRDLEEEIRLGRFREDLYYRLKVCPVHVPPLRERPEDIPVLTSHYLALLAERERRPPPTLSPAALEKLFGYDWPGNVRQLVAVLQRALLLAPGAMISPEHIDIPSSSRPSVHTYREAKVEFERRYYEQLLRTAGGKIALAARLAQKTRKEVYDALRRLNLAPDTFRDDE